MEKNNLKSLSTYFGNIAYDEKIPQESIDRLVNDINKIDRND